MAIESIGEVLSYLKTYLRKGSLYELYSRMRKAFGVSVTKSENSTRREMTNSIGSLATYYAEQHDIDPKIFLSLIWQESRGDILAARFEPRFHARYVENKTRKQLSGFTPNPIPTLHTEKVFRSTSYGLCQILGDTYRWFYKGEAQYLDVALRNPEINLDCGASYLAYLTRRRGGSVEQGLRLYNGSGLYPPIILGHAKQKRYLPLYEMPV